MLPLGSHWPRWCRRKTPNELYAVIDTNRGIMEFLLYRQVAPVTVTNFVNLATRGYYDGLTFHRVIDDFMAQGGDPMGNGAGGPGYSFEDEIRLRHNQLVSCPWLMRDRTQMAVNSLSPTGRHVSTGCIPYLDLFSRAKKSDRANSCRRYNQLDNEGNTKAFGRKTDRVYSWNQSLDLLFP